MTAPEFSFQKEYPANTQGVLEFLSELERMSEERGWTMETANHWALMAEEIATNIAKYAYPKNQTDKQFQITLEQHPKGISLEFLDHGVPYNPLEEEDPDRTGPIEDMPIGGLGVFLVKQMADDLEYQRKEEKNWLRIEKTLNVDPNKS